MLASRLSSPRRQATRLPLQAKAGQRRPCRFLKELAARSWLWCGEPCYRWPREARCKCDAQAGRAGRPRPVKKKVARFAASALLLEASCADSSRSDGLLPLVAWYCSSQRLPSCSCYGIFKSHTSCSVLRQRDHGSGGHGTLPPLRASFEPSLKKE